MKWTARRASAAPLRCICRILIPVRKRDCGGIASEPERDIPALPEGATFEGKTILIVDDDTRNIFAISSVLEARGIKVLHAENGETGLALLEAHPEVDLVLMDIMMPLMDGMVATQKIRQLPHFKSLPIISLTAKAMKGDRDQCIEAGASDYITKPVDSEKLLSLIYTWIHNHVTVECLSKDPSIS